jgi:hypothetical protein
MALSQISQAWAERGFSCTVWTDPPGQVWANFVHEVDELVTLAEGEIELSFQGQTLRPRIGEESVYSRWCASHGSQYWCYDQSLVFWL